MVCDDDLSRMLVRISLGITWATGCRYIWTQKSQVQTDTDGGWSQQLLPDAVVVLPDEHFIYLIILFKVTWVYQGCISLAEGVSLLVAYLTSSHLGSLPTIGKSCQPFPTSSTIHSFTSISVASPHVAKATVLKWPWIPTGPSSGCAARLIGPTHWWCVKRGRLFVLRGLALKTNRR